MLVSVAELAAYMDRSLTNRQEDNAATVLQGVQAEVEVELNRPVEVREFVEDYIVEDTYSPICRRRTSTTAPSTAPTACRGT